LTTYQSVEFRLLLKNSLLVSAGRTYSGRRAWPMPCTLLPDVTLGALLLTRAPVAFMTPLYIIFDAANAQHVDCAGPGVCRLPCLSHLEYASLQAILGVMKLASRWRGDFTLP
jgi:hypothetical protein